MSKLEFRCPDCSRILKIDVDIDSKVHTIPKNKLEKNERAVFITEISEPFIKELKKASWIYHIFESVSRHENLDSLLSEAEIEKIRADVKSFAKKDRSSKFLYFISRVYNVKEDAYIGELYITEPIIAVILWYLSEKEGTDFISKTISFTSGIHLHLAYTKETSICVITRIDQLKYPKDPIDRFRENQNELICGIPRKFKFEVKKNYLRPIFEK